MRTKIFVVLAWIFALAVILTLLTQRARVDLNDRKDRLEELERRLDHLERVLNRQGQFIDGLTEQVNQQADELEQLESRIK